MRTESFRNALRAHTSPVHHQLDKATGAIDTHTLYRAFIRNTFRFRAAVEETLAADRQWTVDAIAPLVALDLADVGEGIPPQAAFAVREFGTWSRLGVHYVLEGSSLGAPLLLRRAEALGMSALFGARHLAHQAKSTERWRKFVKLLNQVPEESRSEVLTAADATFRFALSVYSEAANEPR